MFVLIKLFLITKVSIYFEPKKLRYFDEEVRVKHKDEDISFCLKFYEQINFHSIVHGIFFPFKHLIRSV